MAYTNTWDDSTPLDTQAANQGAADFRQLKLDVMQRIASFGAGLLSARPTPETTSATADWTGVVYWATDTSQMFRWTGTAWVDITADFFGTPVIAPYIFSYGEVDNPGNTNENTLFTGTLSANSLGTNKALILKALVNASVSGGYVTVRVYLNNVLLASTTTLLSSNGQWNLESVTLNKTSASQVSWLTLTGSVSSEVTSLENTTVDTTVDQVYKVTMQASNGGTTGGFSGGFAKVQ